jgi:hypothetical protein
MIFFYYLDNKEKMSRFWILLILISLYEHDCHVKPKNSTAKPFQKLKNAKIWLGLGVFNLRQFKVSNRANEQIQQKIPDELDRIKEGVLVREEEMRRKIYKTHLLPYELGSSVLRDFLTNRI